MELQGKVIQELPLLEGISKAGKPWKKKEWVLETISNNGNFARRVKVDFFGDRVDQNPLVVGQNYSLSIDIESREFNGRWYTDVHAWQSRPLDNASAQSQQANPFGSQPAAPAFGANSFPEPNEADDLPF